MRIAIIGSGISGLTCAHLLHGEHDITLYEAGTHIGGHTHTHDVEDPSGPVAVDTGFIVFNEHNYPNFTRLLEQLGVASQTTRMGFSVRDDRDGTEYSGASLGHVFAQPANALRPSFHRMVFDLLRFYREAPALLEHPDEALTLGAYLRSRGYGWRFIEQHIVPMGAALWSSSEANIESFPARYFVQFLHNHRMLHLRGRPQWRVVSGGSREYVRKLIVPFRERILMRTPVQSISRDANGVTVRARGHEAARFDRAILACHSDQALSLLSDPSVAEREILGALRFAGNDTVLHTDTRVMPRTRKTWSSWNYHVHPDRALKGSARVTYDMNILQSLQAEREYCVTLNGSDDIDSSQVLERLHYEHPQYTSASVAAQKRYDEIAGHQRTWYCGAYWGWGFHEDGVRSALRVCEDFDARL